MAVSNDRPGPYAPSSAIIDLINRARNRGLQSPVTAEVLGRSGISDSLIPRTLQSLISLELIGEDGRHTDTLAALQRVHEKEFQSALAGWIRGVYADVLSYVDPADDESELRDAFRSYNPIGQQSRMVSLFVGLCRAAGLRTDAPASEPRPRSRANLAAGPPRQPRRQSSASGGAVGNGKKFAGSGVPEPIAGLLSKLPPEGQTWTVLERNRFLTTFAAVLDFCYPRDEGAESGQLLLPAKLL